MSRYGTGKQILRLFLSFQFFPPYPLPQVCQGWVSSWGVVTPLCGILDGCLSQEELLSSPFPTTKMIR